MLEKFIICTVMIDLQKSLRVNHSLPHIFAKLFEDNQSIFDEHMKLIKWERHSWSVKRKCKQRKEDVYLYIPSLPDELTKYTVENDKYLNIHVKNKITVDTPEYQKIKTKFKVLNLNAFLRTLLNDLHVVNIKNVIELVKVDENTTDIKIHIIVSLKIPKTKAIEQFVANLSDNLIDSALCALNK